MPVGGNHMSICAQKKKSLWRKFTHID